MPVDKIARLELLKRRHQELLRLGLVSRRRFSRPVETDLQENDEDFDLSEEEALLELEREGHLRALL